MVKIVGGKTGSVSRLKKEAQRSGGRTWIRGIKAGEDLTIRFLTEPDEWYSYREHYDKEVYFFPCIGKEQDCPGCHSDDEKVQRTSRRYLANALDVDTGQVVPLKLPLDLANRLVARYERYGNTIMDREYELHRMGSGLDTTYDVTPEAPQSLDTSRYQLIDLEEVLVASFEESFEDDTGDDPDEGVPSRPSRAAEPEPEPDDDDGEFLTEEQALKMDKADLSDLADRLGVEIDGRWAKKKIVDAIFAQAD